VAVTDQARLAGEALVHARVAQVLGAQHLERDAAAELIMLGEEHLAHAARAERTQNYIGAYTIAGSDRLAAMERNHVEGRRHG
jgi:hypothetical protein